MVLFCLFTVALNGQTRYFFPEGLAIGNVHQYGREALYSDGLAFQLYNAGIKPAAGESLSFAGGSKKAEWSAIKPDSAGNFRSAALGSGYLYLTYTSPKNHTAVLVATGHSMVYVNGAPHAGDMYRYGWMNIPVQLKKRGE